MNQIRKLLFAAMLITALFLSACQSTEFDIRGTWTYEMTDSNQNTYDAGAITFEGTPAKGTFRQVNIYDIEYEGTYRVKGTELILEGDEYWKATFLSADRFTGDWDHGEEGMRGTVEAVRVP
ncbi:MAG: hypothetical protein V2J07_10335 [Anaerolineae bacterium]|jgi:hypothetical protein|nr:hypothetical protein [Anaerolineae bacterium]